jgi:hypothetical protein
MGCLQSAGHLKGDIERPSYIHRAAAAHMLAQGFAFNVLSGNVVGILISPIS